MKKTYAFHRLCLGSRTDSRYGQTDVNGRTNTLVEQLGLQEDLTVSDGDHVGRDVCTDITSLGFNNLFE